MADDPLAAHYQRRLAASLGRYQRTRNPLYLWSAYSLARQGRLPIPEEVLSYFDRAACVLESIEMECIQGS